MRIRRYPLVSLFLATLLTPLWAWGAPEPDVILDVPADGFIGQNFSFTVSFDNISATASDVGFGPFIDVILPKNGADGLAGGGPQDGISFSSSSSFGAPVDILVQEFPAPGGQITHPLTGETITGTPGDELVVLLMPFGSFTPDQPPSPVTVNVVLSDHADLDFALPVAARAGFQFGDTALGTNGPITQDPNNFPGSSTFIPKLFIVEKSIGGGATGPNYLYQGVITVDAAPGQVLSSVVVEDFLPKEMQYQGIVSIAPGTGICNVAVEPPTDAPQNEPDSLLQVSCTELTGGNPIVVTYSYFYPEFDADGAPILNPEFGVNPITGECGGVANTADGRGLWDPIDPRDSDQPTSKTSGIALAETCHHVISKDVEILVDNGAPGLSDDDILQYTYSYEVSDYFTLGGPPQPGSVAPDIVSTLFIDDTLSDGQVFNWNFSPTYELTNRGEVTTGVFTAGQILEPSITNLGVDETQQPQSTQFPGLCGSGESILTFDLSQQLIDDGATGGVLEILGGLVDLDGNGVADDTGVFGGIDIIDGYVDLDGEGDVPDTGDVLDPADDTDSGEIAADTVSVIDGLLDVDLDGVVGTADDSYFYGVQVVDGTLVTPDGVVGGFDVIGGGIDFDGSGVVDAADDGAIAVFYDTIASLVDLDDDGAITTSDNGFIFGVPVLAGFVDIDLSTAIDTDDDGAMAGFSMIGGEIDINNDAVIDGTDDGFIFDTPIIDGRVDVNGDGVANDTGSVGPAGSLTGGCVASSSQSPTGAPGAWDDYTLFPCNPDTTNLQPPATGSFTYQTIMLDEYSCSPPADRSIDQGDGISNIVEVNTDILENREPRIITGPAGENPDSPPPYEAGAGLSVPVGEISKSVYAINGDPNDPLLAVDYAGGNRVQFAPGDTVTYRIRYEHPSSDFQNFRFVDYLPFPSLQVGDADADNSAGPGWTFLDQPSGGTINAGSQVACDSTPTGTPPLAGVVTFGAGDTFHCHPGTPSIPADSIDPAIPPAIATDDIGNTLTLTYGSFDNQENAGSVVELLFTVTVQDDFFTDGLFLTNQVRAIEENSTGDQTPADAIVQIQLSRPEVNIKKGIVDTDHPSAEFTPTGEEGPVTFTPVADTSCPRFTGTITSDGLDATPINSDLTGVDANALVTKAILIENTGKGINGAFNVRFQDDLPTGLAPAPAGFNLCITDGTGNVLYDAGGVTTGVAVVDSATGTCTATIPEDAIFDPNCALEFVDPAPDFPFPPAAAPPQGSLAPGQVQDPSVPGTFLPNDTGDNIAVITYDLEVLTSTSPAQELTNTAVLSNYAFITDGEDLTPVDLTDPATITVGDPNITKSIIATSEGHTPGTAVAIGETVQYQVVINIPQGFQDGVVLTDVLTAGLVFESFDSIAVVEPTAGDVTTSQGTFNDVLNNATGVGTSQALFDFGRIENADSDVQSIEQLVVTYTARVTNGSPGRGDVLDNAAQWSWNSGANTIAADADDLVVVEPELLITKDAVPVTGTAGDVITFTVTVAHTGASNTAAFDLIVTDDILGNADYTLVNGSVNAPGGTVVSSAGSVEVHYDAVLLGGSASFTFDATLNDTVQIGGTADNTASLDHYDTLPADDSPNERDYGPVSDDATVTIDAPAIDKSIVSISPDLSPDVAGNEAPVGSIIRYQVMLTVPEGTSDNATLVDTLDSGLAFVGCVGDVDLGTASVTPFGGFAVSGSLPCSDGIAPGSNPLIENDGGKITWDLGTVTVPGTTGAGTTITFVYDVVVLNTTANAHNTQRNNLVTWSWDNDAGTQTINDSADDVTIVEPLLSIGKALDPTGGDAGDMVVVTLTIGSQSPANRSPAYDVRLEDALPLEMIFVGPFDTTNCAAGAVPDTAQHDGSPSGGMVSFDWSSFPKLTTCQISFPVQIAASAAAGSIINNEAVIDWTSLPPLGPETDLTTYNDFGCERTSPTVGIARLPNPDACGEGVSDDYTADDDAEFEVIGAGIEKSVFSTSEISTGDGQHNGGIEDLTIGEEVTYEIVVTLPEGTTSQVIVTDTMPSAAAGTIEVLSLDSITVGANLTPANALPPFGECAIAGVCDDLNLGDGINDTIDLDFGQVVNNDTTGVTDDDDRIVIRATGRLIDTAANSDGDRLTNSVLLQFGPGLDGSASADIDVVEPLLNIDKSCDANTGEGGDVITCTVRIEHLSGSTTTAFDLAVDDILPDGMTYSTANFSIRDTGNADVNATSLNVTADVVEVVYDDLPLGEIGEFEFQVTLDDAGGEHPVTPGQVITNNANLSWDTLPADSDPDERVYGAGDGHTVTVSAGGVEKFVQSTSEDSTGTAVNGPEDDLTIGETVTYQFDALFISGTTESVVVTDQLPTSGVVLQLQSSRIVSIGSNITSLGGGQVVDDPGDDCLPDCDTNTDTVRDLAQWDLDDVSASAGDEDSRSILFEVTAVVLDNSLNNGGVDNDVVNTARVVDASNPQGVVATAQVDLVEPLLEISKQPLFVGDPPYFSDAGDIITYELTIDHTSVSTADAFNLVITDVLDPGMNWIDDATVSGSCGASVDSSGGSSISYSVSTLALPTGSCTVTYQAQVDISASASDTLTNTATLQYDSTPEFVAGETRRQTVTTSSDVIISAPTLIKEVQGSSLGQTGSGEHDPTVPDLAIGELVTYLLTVTFQEGTTDNATLTENMPADIASGFIEAINATVFTVGANITTTLPGTPVLQDNVPDAPNPALNDTIVMDFGTVTNAGTDDVLDEDDQLQVLVTGRVVDVPENSDSDTLTNSATLTFDGGGPLVDDAKVEIVEPDVALTKFMGPLEGNLVTMQFAFANNGNAPAYDFVFTDDFDESLWRSLSASDADLPAGYKLSQSSSAGLTTVTVELDCPAPCTNPTGEQVLLPGQTLVFSFKMELLQAPLEGIDNTADAAVTSVPGTDHADANERDYSAPASDTLTFDFDGGDAPDSYGTLFSSGPIHAIRELNNLYLGAEAPDSEVDGQPSPEANGDDVNGTPGEEAGVILAVPAGGGDEILAQVTVTNNTGSPVTLCGWMDTGDGAGGQTPDGDFDNDTTEEICITVTDSGTTTVTDVFRWNVGPTATQSFYARFRVCSLEEQCNAPTGSARDGEVEDYVILYETTVSGHLYEDTDGNGVQDPGEPDLAGVDVLVTDSLGNTQTVTTDGNGDWTAVVPPGSTTADVDETDPDYPALSTQTEGTDPTTVTAVGGVDTSAGNDGYAPPLIISGTVFDDGDGLNDSIVDGTGLGVASGFQLYVNILDAAGNVVAVAVVNANGTYGAEVPPLATYSLQLSTTPGTVGAPAPAQTLPAGWVYTGEDCCDNTGDDGTVDGLLLGVSVGTADVTQANFGIEQPPTASDATEPAQVNPGGTTQVPVPDLTAAISDPEDTTPTTIVIETIPDPATEGVLYYDGTPVTAGQVIVNFDPALLTLDPVDGDVTVAFDYSTVDAAGEKSNIATVTMPFVQPKLELIKSLVPDSDGGTFDLLIDGVLYATGGNGTATGQVSVDAGATVTIAEQAVSPASLNPYDISFGCLDGNGSTVSVANETIGATEASAQVTIPSPPTAVSAADVTLTCTITNNRGGNITITKVANPPDETNFNFSSTLVAGAGSNQIGDFVLDGEPVDGADADDYDNQDGFQVSSNHTYSITEVLPGGWVLTGISCTDTSANSSGDPATLTATLVIDPGDTITCTFTNVQTGTIAGTIWLDNDGDGVLDAGESGVGGVTVLLLDGNGNPVLDGAGNPITAVTDANGDYVFPDLAPGNYQVQVDPSELIAGDLAGLDEAPGNVGGLAAVSLSPGGTEEADFGYVPQAGTGVVEGTVWGDADADGIQDAGEVGIGGVTVNLYDDADGNGVFGSAGDNVVATAVTGPDGSYALTGIPPGEYVAVVDAATVPAGYGATTPTASVPIDVTAGSVTTDVDFGFDNPTGTGSISDAIFNDADDDGVLDPGEAGIGGVTVDLYEDTDGDGVGDVLIGSVTTDPDGTFNFDGIPSTGTEDYVIVVSDNDGVLNTLTETTATGGTVAITDLSGDLDNTAAPSFGYNQPGTISGTIYSDADGLGALDAADSGLGGVPVELWEDTDGDGSPDTLLVTVTTAADGSYHFDGIAPGDYVVVVNSSGTGTGVPPTGTQTGDPDGALDNATPVTLAAGGSAPNLDFGYNDPALDDVIGTVFNDLDTDGTYEPDGTDGTPGTTDDESGIGGVTLSLSPTYAIIDGKLDVNGDGVIDGFDDGIVDGNMDGSPVTVIDGQLDINGDGVIDDNDDGTYNGIAIIDGLLDSDGNGTAGEATDVGRILGDPIATTTSDPTDGTYAFTDVPDGDYQVQVTDTGNVLDGMDLTSGLDAQPVTADSTVAGDPEPVDFGYVDDAQTASITSGLWIDSDGDGVRDPDEPAISGVTVSLLDCGADGICGTADDGATRTAQTDANGNVIFADLPPGNYFLDVDETDPDFPAGLVETSYAGVDPNSPIALSEGESYDADFGYVAEAGTAMLSGTLWSDVDGDGVSDPGEVGLGGITVTLYDATGAVLATTLTNADGSYTFTGLAPGDYNVSYDAAAVTALGLDGAEPTNTPDNGGGPGGGPDGINDDIYNVTLAAGDIVENLDYGFDAPTATTPTGSVDGYVYYEPAPANGDRDGADSGIESVTVNLVDGGGNVIATVETSDGSTDVDGDGVIDPAGYYSFQGVLPGDYTVVVSDTNNATTGLNPTENSTGTSPTLNVTGGGTASADFGYTGEQTLGTIGNLVWLDVDNNGIFEPTQGDVGIAGVTVELWLDVDQNQQLIIDGVDNLIGTVTTDLNGTYNFGGIPSGQYLVRVTDEQGALVGYGNATVHPGSGAPTDDDNYNRMAIMPTGTAAYWLFTDAGNLTADFAVTGTATVSGVAYDNTPSAGDTDYDSGTDTPVGGVAVTLYKVEADGSLTPLQTVTTAADGSYIFTSVPIGVELQVIADPTGTTVDGFTGAENAAGALIGPLAVGATDTADFGYEQPPVTTTPITLGYFRSDAGVNPGDVAFTWQTVTELGNVGFNLYVYGGDEQGSWEKVNEAMIAAHLGETLETQVYTYSATEVTGTVFALSDVDVFGNETVHGPFTLGVEHGVDRSVRAKTDWEAIRAEHEGKVKARQGKRRGAAKQRLQRRLDRVLDDEERQMRRQLKRAGRPLSWHSGRGSESSWSGRLLAGVLSVLVGTAQAGEPVGDAGLVRIPVRETGIHRVTYEALAATGTDLAGVRTDRLALTNQGQPVAIHVQGQGEEPVMTHGKRGSRGSTRYFGPGGYIEFVGEGLDTLYTDTNVYVLYVDAGRHVAIGSGGGKVSRKATPVTVYQETVRLDDNQFYSQASTSGDPWYLQAVSASDGAGPVRVALPVVVEDLAPGGGLVQVVAELWGRYYGVTHQVSVGVNGADLASASFVDFEARTVQGDTDATQLDGGGGNTVDVTVYPPAQGVDYVAVEALSLTYPRQLIARAGKLSFSAAGAAIEVAGLPGEDVRVYRVNADGGVEVLDVALSGAGGEYRARFPGTPQPALYHVADAGALTTLAAEALEPVIGDSQGILSGAGQYLVIAHADFIDTNMELLVQARQGQYASVKVADSDAVYAQFGGGVFGAQPIADYIAWAQANLGTDTVLLVGSDHYDYRNYQYPGAVSFLPSWYAATDGLVQVAPVDAKYADTDGDDVPDVSIGRLIPRTSAEWAAIVAKTLAYAQHPNPVSVVLAADAYDQAQAYDFRADADAMWSTLPGAWQAETTKVYLDSLGNAEARSALLAALDAGPAVAAFVGHSGPRDWTFSGLFRAGDAKALSNHGAATVVTQFGCWNTYYVYPSEDSLAHEFLLNGEQGAAAVLGGTTLTQAPHERALAEQLFPLLASPGKAIGQAVLEAKRAYAETAPEHHDVILGWNLLADPGLVVAP